MLAGLWLFFVSIINVVDDLSVVSMSWLSLTSHYDLFNVGLLLGKGTKFLTQLYYQGFILKEH